MGGRASRRPWGRPRAPRGGRRGDGAGVLERLRALLAGEHQGKSLEVTWYDGTVETVRDPQPERAGPPRKGPAFIEVR